MAFDLGQEIGIGDDDIAGVERNAIALWISLLAFEAQTEISAFDAVDGSSTGAQAP